MANQWDTSPYPVDGAASEAKDCAPVARGTVPERDKWFWVAASMAQDAGHISSEGLKRVQVALYGEAVAL